MAAEKLAMIALALYLLRGLASRTFMLNYWSDCCAIHAVFSVLLQVLLCLCRRFYHLLYSHNFQMLFMKGVLLHYSNIIINGRSNRLNFIMISVTEGIAELLMVGKMNGFTGWTS